MAYTVKSTILQSMAEIRQWEFDFNSDLPAGGVTVVSATAQHIPPSGPALTPVVGAAVAGVVPVLLGPMTGESAITGEHILICKATYSNGERAEIRLIIPVHF